MDSITEKVCLDCKESKPISDFGKRSESKDRIHYYCKECISKRGRKWREKNNELFLAICKQSRNRPKSDEQKEHERKLHREAGRRYYERNREKLRLDALVYNASHRLEQREYNKAKSATDSGKEQNRLKETKRNRTKKENGGDFTNDEWLALCNNYDNKCIGTGPHEGILTVDHVIPISKGGTNDIGNIQPLCLRCNVCKSTHIVDYRT